MFAGTKCTLSRIGQWNGPRTSTRHEPWILTGLRNRPAISRLAIAQLTSIAIALFIYLAGPPFPYRLGETPNQDVRVRAYFEVVNQPHTEYVREEEQIRLGSDVEPDEKPIVERYPPGLPLAKRGHPISEVQLGLLEEEHRAFVHGMTFKDNVRVGVGLLMVCSLLTFVVCLYVARFQQALAGCPGKIGRVCVLIFLTLMAAQLLSTSPWQASMLPLAFTAMVMTIAYNAPFALLIALSMSLITSLGIGGDISQVMILMSGQAPAILLLRKIQSRTRLVEVAAGAGTVAAVMTLASGLLDGETASFIGFDAARHCVCCLLAGFILTGALPFIERGFGIVTDMSLLELADSSHPLLQELIRRAPGTYTHSMTVATLAESAADSINANALLARVGSYFHDVGKMLKPHYFIENQSGENRHDQLEPGLSALVILGHVKDGIALAEQYRLPAPVIEFIAQHHGTTLVEYFFREAIRMQEPSNLNLLEVGFRYSGPKPQTRENGIVMLADAVESMSRSLKDPTPSSLRKLVRDMTMKRLLDGQFDESGLTLTDLHKIEESLAKSLVALFHARIRYPDLAIAV